MNNYKSKKTSAQLLPFQSSSKNPFISVKGALSISLETEEYFATFYIIKNTRCLKVSTNIIKSQKNF